MPKKKKIKAKNPYKTDGNYFSTKIHETVT